MTPEVKQQIAEWGTVFETIRHGGFYVNETFYAFEGLFDFAYWYEGMGYGGDPFYVEDVAKSLIEADSNGVAIFFHFLTALKEEHTTPSEGAKNV